MLDEAELNRVSAPEPAGLTRVLLTVAGERGDRRRRLLIGAALGCAVALAAWIGVLAVTLPWRYRAGGWSAAWVGFDAVLFLAFAATAWAAWRRRQILILCLVVVATLLCCDAWFDTTLDWGTPGFAASLTLALLVELPLAVLALVGARRLLRLTFSRLDALRGTTGAVPPLWKVPLFGHYSAGDGYRDLFRPPHAPPAAAELAEAEPDGPGPAGAKPDGSPSAAAKPDGPEPAGAKPDGSPSAAAEPGEAAPGPGDRAA